MNHLITSFKRLPCNLSYHSYMYTYTKHCIDNMLYKQVYVYVHFCAESAYKLHINIYVFHYLEYFYTVIPRWCVFIVSLAFVMCIHYVIGICDVYSLYTIGIWTQHVTISLSLSFSPLYTPVLCFTAMSNHWHTINPEFWFSIGIDYYFFWVQTHIIVYRLLLRL